MNKKDNVVEAEMFSIHKCENKKKTLNLIMSLKTAKEDTRLDEMRLAWLIM